MATGDHKQMPQRVIYAKEIVGVGTQFGPYPGKDAKERKFSEWMAFVCKAETQQQANLLSFVTDGQKYFRSCKIIQPFETFIVWDKNNEECKSQTDSKEQHNSYETQDVNGGAPLKMNLRKKKSVTYSSEVAKLNNTKPVRSAKEIKTNSKFFEANEVVSMESTSHTENRANLDDMETEESLFRCSDCSEEFVSNAGLAVHRLLHGQDQRCLTCGKKFTPHENLHQHLLSHTPKTFTTCNECFRYFDKEFDLGPCSNKSSKKSLCMECESLVIINREITIAKQITGEMMCNYCGRIYFNKKSLKAHLNKHNSKYCCRKCGKVFGTYNAITRHIVVHTNFKPFKCEVCGMRFTRSSTSQDHIKLCRKRSKGKDKVLQMTNIPINGKRVENTEKNESNVVLNKAYNTRSSSRSKLDSSTIGNEKTDALDCAFGLEDNSSLISPNGAEFFHCQLENNNIMSNGNTNFPSGSEQHSASQKRVDELNYQHYSSSTCNGQMNLTFLPDNDNIIRIESANSNQFISTDISDEIEIICLSDDEEDTPLVTNNNNYNNNTIKSKLNVMNSSELTSLKINGNTCHDCSVKISSLYNCTECYKVFASIEGLTMHRLVHFCGQTCTKCGNSFTRDRKMKEHLLGHSSDDIKNCLKCEIIFGNPFNYYQTLTTETMCSLCNECDIVTSVEAYEKTSSLEIKESGLNECIYDESFCTTKNFQKHKTTHLNGISCSECGSCFLSYEELNEHISVHVKCQIQSDFSVIKSENEELNKTCSKLIENASNSNHTKRNDENNLASSNSSDDTSRSSNETINSNNNKLLENSELISKVPMQDEGTVFHYECNECKRNFLTEAGVALHAHLHLDQKCILCGDHIEWDFDSMFNDDPKNFMLCGKCMELSK